MSHSGEGVEGEFESDHLDPKPMSPATRLFISKATRIEKMSLMSDVDANGSDSNAFDKDYHSIVVSSKHTESLLGKIPCLCCDSPPPSSPGMYF